MSLDNIVQQLQASFSLWHLLHFDSLLKVTDELIIYPIKLLAWKVTVVFSFLFAKYKQGKHDWSWINPLIFVCFGPLTQLMERQSHSNSRVLLVLKFSRSSCESVTDALLRLDWFEIVTLQTLNITPLLYYIKIVTTLALQMKIFNNSYS